MSRQSYQPLSQLISEVLSKPSLVKKHFDVDRTRPQALPSLFSLIKKLYYNIHHKINATGRCSHADQNMNQVNKFNATDRGEPRPSGQESPLIPYYSRHRKTDRDRKARQHRFSQLKYF